MSQSTDSDSKLKLPFMELGSTGLRRHGGFIHEEFLKELQGTRGAEAWRQMRDNESIVGAILFSIKMLIRQVEWRFEAASDSSEDKAAADFIDEVLFQDMSQTWEDTVSEILSFLPFGWSYHEIVYKRRLGDTKDPSTRSRFKDGKIGVRKLPIRAQETLWEWKFDESGGIRGMIQLAPPSYKTTFIPIEKALLFRTEVHKGNPEGRSILRNAYRTYYFKRHVQNIEGIGIERDLAGLPVALVPPQILDPNAGQAERAMRTELEKIIKNIRRDEQEGILFPKASDSNGKEMFELKLLSTGGSRQFDVEKTIDRLNREMAMTVLADFILLGHEKTGSFALSSSKTNLFSTAIGAWMDSISGVFNRFLIPRLFKLNSMNIETLPKLVHGDIESFDLIELGNYITQLAGAGVELFPDKELETFLKRQAGLPVNSEDG